MEDLSHKTPQDVSAFEREQLIFFAKNEELASLLHDLNPSLAWLPFFRELNLVTGDKDLVPWIGRNFTHPEAVEQVVANIRFFRAETADLMEMSLNRTRYLAPPLEKCWRLIIRHLRSARRQTFREWFDIQQSLKNGDTSSELLERLVTLVRPKLHIDKRLSLYNRDRPTEISRPSDLMSIRYLVDDSINAREVLAALPKCASAETDDRLLQLLTQTLEAVLRDAIDVGVEGDHVYGLSDADVPSIAEHGQNEYHSGFLVITRITADLWTRLAEKQADLALHTWEHWSTSSLRLLRRLALFAAANPTVPAELAANLLASLPADQLFLAGASVEVHRLIRARWKDFSSEKRGRIEVRAAIGPPPDAFVRDADIGDVLDSSRFELLGQISRQGIGMSEVAENTLRDIRTRRPEWQFRPEEQAGFHIWHHGSRWGYGDSSELDNVPTDLLLAKARDILANSGRLNADSWQALCRNNPKHALQGLEASARQGEWPGWAWSAYLWAPQEALGPDTVRQIAELLRQCPDNQLVSLVDAASWWLSAKAKELDDSLMWFLWDQIERSTPRDDIPQHSPDALTEALNSPAGRLIEVLLSKLGGEGKRPNLPEEVQSRFDRILESPGTFGRLARIRVAAEVALLFDQAPDWTKQRIVPFFSWKSPEALAVWSSRGFSNYIGSPQLFRELKQPFLELFRRADVPSEMRKTYADWIVAVMIANRAHHSRYPLTESEARSALRRVGTEGLASVAHRLAMEMRSAPSDAKPSTWREIVGPVFESLWPLDAELQSADLTIHLVQILLASKGVFSEAFDMILPFIRPEDSRRQNSILAISYDADELLFSSPEKMLDLADAIVGDSPSGAILGLRTVLDRIRDQEQQLATTRKFQKLASAAGEG